MQYQQNFIPAVGSMGAGSARKSPTKNMTPPRIDMGNPKIETPRGAYRSIITRKRPNTPRIMPEATSPLYISIHTGLVIPIDMGLSANSLMQHDN